MTALFELATTTLVTLPDRPILTALLAFTAPVVLLAGRFGTKETT